MVMQIKSGKSEHQKIIEKMVNKLKEKGYYVEANIPTERCPYPILGYIPDIIAYRKGSRIIVEVETIDSLQDEEILLERLSIFSRMRMGKNEFYIIVPDEAILEVKGKLDYLNITVDKLSTYTESISEEEESKE